MALLRDSNVTFARNGTARHSSVHRHDLNVTKCCLHTDPKSYCARKRQGKACGCLQTRSKRASHKACKRRHAFIHATQLAHSKQVSSVSPGRLTRRTYNRQSATTLARSSGCALFHFDHCIHPQAAWFHLCTAFTCQLLCPACARRSQAT